MKRFVSSIVVCTSLLAVLTFWLFPVGAAKEDAIITLLNLPAPPAPNPHVQVPMGTRPPEFYSKDNPPPDDAPIEDLMEYWSRMSSGFQALGYSPRPSAATADRILREIAGEPQRIVEFLNIFQDDRRVQDIVLDAYNRSAAGGEEFYGYRDTMRRWLMLNTPEFADELEKVAVRASKDTGEYVSNQDELLALARVDWSRAEPIVNAMYADKSQKTAQVLAIWALYRHALETGGTDVDRYRDELKAVVENKEASAGMRDLAMDALFKEKEWSGRDDWYVTLLEDETLHDLRVNGTTYTGLTTIMYYTPDDQLVDRMIGLLGSDNILVRSAAAKNLLVRLNRLGEHGNVLKIRTEIVRMLLPWLSDRKWLKLEGSQRLEMIRSLSYVKLPESVPVLIEALDEKETLNHPINANTANTARGAAVETTNSAANSASVAVNTYSAAITNSNTGYYGGSSTYYPLRSTAITALAFQADGRAAPALRRVLVESDEWERTTVVKALLACQGFSTEERVAALEFLARTAGDLEDETSSGNPAVDRARVALRVSLGEHGTTVETAEDGAEAADREFDDYGRQGPPSNVVRGEDDHDHYDGPTAPKVLTEEDLKYLLASQLIGMDDVDDDLIRATVDRVSALSRPEPVVAETLRKVLIGWNGRAVNSMLLRDIGSGRMDADGVLKLLAIRKQLRETQAAEISELRSGVPAAAGIAACLLEEAADYEAILTNGPDAARISLLACARLIRAPLSVQRTAPLVKSQNRILAVAAERFLESEDSAEARAVVRSLYPNQVKILGATTVFAVDGLKSSPGNFLRDIFRTVNPYFGSMDYAYLTFTHDGDFASMEKRLRQELAADQELTAVYAYDKFFVKVYKDKAFFSWEDDPARYREREMDPAEVDSLRSYLAEADAENLPPFLACTNECHASELLILNREGGRRVFLKANYNYGAKPKLPPFFANLDAFFEQAKQRPTQLKYYAAGQIPGLELVYGGDEPSARSVWKQGPEIRVLANDAALAKRIKEEIDRAAEQELAELEAEGNSTDAYYTKFQKIREAREFESFNWFRLADGRLAEPAMQPGDAMYIPIPDGIVPPPQFGGWTSRAGATEVRIGDDGLYKVTGGRSVKFKSGYYSGPIVVTPNGRWAVATKYDDETGLTLVRIDIATGRELKFAETEYPMNRAIAYIPGRNLVLATADSEGDHHGEEEPVNESAYDNGQGYFFADPDTGRVYPAAGEVRPMAQQTFRGLQSTGVAGEYWAAIPRGTSGTIVGTYSTRNFSFRPLLKLPKLIFDSTEMWVDAAERKVYFTYEGHVLAAPIPPEPGPRR